MDVPSGDTLDFELDQICTNLQNPERSIRTKGLKKFLGMCDEGLINKENAVNIFDKCYLHIFKCYADKFESCRTVACSIVSALLDILPENDYYIGYIIPVIVKRCGQKEIIEESEEMRLQLIQQLLYIVKKFKCNEDDGDPLMKLYNDIMDILQKTLTDPYPAVQRESCLVVEELSEATKSFHFRAEQLVNPLIAMLNHRQSPSRIAAISALGAVLLHLKGEIIFKVLSSISPLLMDSIPQVRRQCGIVGCKLALYLRDRYSFFERILPLILCCLKDDSEEIREEIRCLWVQCGKQYFDENENELQKIELVDYFPKKYPEDVQRPTLGCRAVMQRSLRMITIILKEMPDWKEEVRVHSLKLLWQAVLHCEKACTAKFIEIYPVLAINCMDSEKTIVAEAVKVSQLLGMLLEYDSWIQHGINDLESRHNLGFLRCFTYIYKGSLDEKYKDMARIAGITADPNFSHSLKPRFQEGVLDMVELLVEMYIKSSELLSAGIQNLNLQDNSDIVPHLYTTLVKVIALSDESQEIQNRAKELVIRLAGGDDKVKDLHSQHLNNVLNTIEDLDSEHSELSEPILLLHGMIWYCGFRTQYMDKMNDCIKTVIEHGQPGARIKILSAVSVSMMKWNETVTCSYEESYEALKKFTDNVIVPCLIWKAGRSAESIRMMASATMCSMSQGAPKECYQLFPLLAEHFESILDDNAVATRAYAVRCLGKSGPISYFKIRNIIKGLLARLDDPSIDIREWAIRTICSMQALQEMDGDAESWIEVMKHVLDILFLHLDDPEIRLRKALLESIKVMATTYRELFETAFKDLPANYAHIDDLKQIKESIID